MKKMLLSSLLTTLLMSGCASGNGYWPQETVPNLSKCDGNKWSREGHLNTTHLVAKMAGIDEVEAARLAYFSQVPDDMAFLYSAPSVGIWGIVPPFWSYRSKIVNTLHSLHGGSKEQVVNRRGRLSAMIVKLRSEKAETWKVGFLIHALGDSYAHVRGELDAPHAYGELFGHIFDNANGENQPDIIVANNNYLIYIEYVRDLFEILSRGSSGANRLILSDFVGEIKKQVEQLHVSNDRFVEFVRSYTYCGNDESVYDWPLLAKDKDGKPRELQVDLKAIGLNGEDEIKFGRVSQFLREVGLGL